MYAQVKMEDKLELEMEMKVESQLQATDSHLAIDDFN